MSQFEVVPVEGKSRFHDFVLPDVLMRGIAELGFSYCTPVQAMTLAGALDGTDTIGQAQTGTGKTAAFLVTIMASFLHGKSENQNRTSSPFALIIAPTRELVTQISNDAVALAKFTGIRVAPVFGGMDYEKQQRFLEEKNPEIIVATPGRLLDFIRKKIISLKSLKILVIDEADRMLDMGFIPDVRNIVYNSPPKEQRQTLMFSATLTPEVRHLASQWCVKPVQVEIEPEQVAVDTIEQRVYLTTAQEKYYVLYNMITSQNLEKVLVFANRKDETRRLTERLARNGISCEMLSGDVAQKKRISTLEGFRSGKIKVLVATDVAGRGIHVDDISHVFNYTLPYEAEDYVHRIGRTGRAGKTGIAISFADEDGSFYLPAIEAYIGSKLECVQPDEALLKPAPKGTFAVEKREYPQRKAGFKPSYNKSRRPPAKSRPRSN
jgi:ATP-dependent RNA helicase RhlB